MLGGAGAAWPVLATAQQPKAIRRIAVLTGASGPVSEARVRILVQALGELGWKEGQSAQFDIRHGGANPENIRKYAAELVALAPDVIVANGGTAAGRLLEATRKVPIVFAFVPDPVASGFVDSLSRPGGNATGFTQFEYGFSGKWLELLKEISPNVTRVAVLRDRNVPAGVGQFAVIQSAAGLRGMEAIPINVRDAAEIERDVAAFARSSNGGLIVTSSTNALVHRALIIGLAAQHKLPAVYAQRQFVSGGGLITYASDIGVQLRNAAGYVDRILKGEKPADLPVQAPTKYELVINLKTAKALGLSIPPTLLARADEVIE